MRKSTYRLLMAFAHLFFWAVATGVLLAILVIA